MAFKMDGDNLLLADRETVWQNLNDPEVLKACIPGCQELEQKEDGGFAAVVKVKIGPVSATFKGAVDLTDLDPPNGYRIVGQGEGGAAGFARGGATVGLSEQDGGTLLRYDVDAVIGGRLAQLGGRLVNGVAKKLADEFFANFSKIVEERHRSAAA
jgi:carbon monoxide dehydrogenase subunit G